MGSWRRIAWWCAWGFVVGVLFNSCASHREKTQLGATLEHGEWTPSLYLALQGIRAVHADDGDTNRYLAYANAVLGRPYQGYYVRPMEGWKLDSKLFDTGKDQADPAETPPIRPSASLVPYRDFSVEYPPGFFLFSIPVALLTGDLDGYCTLFSLYMGLLLTIGLVLSERVAKRLVPARAASVVPYATVMAFALGTILVRRYDPAVSVSVCLLLWGCVFRKPVAAGAGFGLGVAAKGLPVMLAPLVLVYWLARGRRREAVVATATAVGMGLVIGIPFLATAGARILDMFEYHGHRPLQIESTFGALLILGRFIDPATAVLSQTFGSANVVASWDGPFRFLAGILPFASLVGVCVWAWRSLRRAQDDQAAGLVLLRAICAALVGWMALGKVFSPQYVTWLIPLGVVATLADRRPSRWCLVGALALTQVIYPFAYCVQFAYSLSPWFGLIVTLRNGLLLAWATWLLRPRPAGLRTERESVSSLVATPGAA